MTTEERYKRQAELYEQLSKLSNELVEISDDENGDNIVEHFLIMGKHSHPTNNEHHNDECDSCISMSGRLDNVVKLMMFACEKGEGKELFERFIFNYPKYYELLPKSE